MKPVIIDVREPYEFKSGHVKGARNIPVTEIAHASQLARLTLDTPLVVYCRSGHRAGIAKHILEAHGYRHVTNGINQEHVEKLLQSDKQA